MRFAIASVIAAIGCGRLGFQPTSGFRDGDASGDGQPGDAATVASCTLTAPVRIAELASTAEDWDVAVAPDRKLIVFASTRDDPQHAHLFCATWLGTQWSSPLALTALNSTNDDTGPAWSPDGTLLYFSSLRTGPDLLYTSSYDGSGCAGFASPALLPGMMNVSAVAPWVASTDLELLYTTEGTGNTYAIGRATRTSPSDPWVDQGALPFDPGRLAGFPSLTPDDLTIFVEDSPAPGTSAAIYRATRASRDDPFGPATPFAPLNDPSADQGDPDVSADGRTIVFASSRTGGAGGNDLYVSTCSD